MNQAQAQSSPVLLPTTQRLIDSLYQVNQQVQQARAIASTDSGRLRLQTLYQSAVARQQVVLQTILAKHDYPDADKVGMRTAHRYATLVGQCTQHVKFQRSVLKHMKPLLGKGIEAIAFAELTDQVELADGRAQVYGTLLAYLGDESGLHARQPLVDPAKVNKRRADIGLEALEVSIDRQMSKSKPSNKPPKQ